MAKSTLSISCSTDDASDQDISENRLAENLKPAL